MPPERRAAIDPQLAKLDREGMLELCQSLADYAEAGGLSRDLMLRAGRHATAQWSADFEVLLAVGRMYRLGGELSRARATLVQAGKITPRDARLLRLLREVLGALGVTDSPEDVLAEAFDEPVRARPQSAAAPKQQSIPPPKPTTGPTPPVKAESARAPSRAPTPPPATPRRPTHNRIRLLNHDDPSRLLEPYELIGEIASGGMASVYLARLTGAGGFQRFVAIKRLHPHLARQDDFVEMFLDEARLAAGIHHPHVVPILEIGQNAAGYYLVMELIEGDTLAGLISRAFALGVMLPRAVAARIVFDAMTGLHAAHQLKDPAGQLLGLIHRDCSPQNILVGVDGNSRITDFGVARAAARYAITRSQVVKGKVAYLSPEQATAGDLDRRSDLFSMGIVLWEALTGRPLFLADNDAVTISRLLSHPIPSIRNFSPDVSLALDEVCGRALQRDPSKRFPTAAAMAEAIERAARASGGLASPGDVTRCVEDLVGAEIAAQREAVRTWLAQHEATPMSRIGTRTQPGVRSSPFADFKDAAPKTPPAASATASAPARQTPVIAAEQPASEAASPAPAAASLAPEEKGDAPAADGSALDAPAGDAPKGDALEATLASPAGGVPAGDAPKDDAPKGDAPKGDAPKGDAPKGDAPKGDAPKETAPVAPPDKPAKLGARRRWIPLAALLLIAVASSPIWLPKLKKLRRDILHPSGVPSGLPSASAPAGASWRDPTAQSSASKEAPLIPSASLSASAATPDEPPP